MREEARVELREISQHPNVAKGDQVIGLSCEL
jgi:hypothetical protein